jgi:hypothetical protein
VLSENRLQILDSQKVGSFFEVQTSGDGLLVLGQGYEKGWLAVALQPNFKFQISNFKLLNHVKVDGWANGWFVPANIGGSVSNIYILFWPQLLEFAGLVITFLLFLTLAFRKNNE